MTIKIKTTKKTIKLTQETKAQRRLKLLKRRGLFGGNTKGAKVVRACTMNDLKQAYELVYQAYLDMGYILPHQSRIRIRTFEAVEEMRTFVAKSNNRVVGVMSEICDSPDLGLPSDSAFKDKIDALRKTGLRLCEASNQVVAPDFRNTGLITELMRCAIIQGVSDESDIMLGSVSTSHKSFCELLGFRQIAEPRSSSKKVEDPVILMSLDLKALQRESKSENRKSMVKEYLVDENPYTCFLKGWDLVARRFFNQPETLRELIVIRSRWLEECSDRERESIFNRWGENLFAKVMGVELAIA